MSRASDVACLDFRVGVQDAQLVNLAAGGSERDAVTFGHPSGTLRVGAEASQDGGDWVVTRVRMSRSARVVMEGVVRIS